VPTKQEYADLTASERKKEDWMNSKWRPMMGWMYMFVCFFDFVLAPILWSLIQAMDHGAVNVQWQPLTLQGAGLFHVAMGAVIGISAYGRTQEKMAGANNGGLIPQGQPVGTTYVPPGTQPGMNTSFGSPGNFNTGSSFGQPTSTFGSPSTSFGSAPPVFGTSNTAPTSFGSAPPAFGSSSSTPPSVLPAGVGAPPPAFGAKPVGPAATAFPPL
jgi:Holin of 3TMs, for gene-transfer release